MLRVEIPRRVSVGAGEFFLMLVRQPVTAHGEGERTEQPVVVKTGQVVLLCLLPRLCIIAQHANLCFGQVQGRYLALDALPEQPIFDPGALQINATVDLRAPKMGIPCNVRP